MQYYIYSYNIYNDFNEIKGEQEEIGGIRLLDYDTVERFILEDEEGNKNTFKSSFNIKAYREFCKDPFVE